MIKVGRAESEGNIFRHYWDGQEVEISTQERFSLYLSIDQPPMSIICGGRQTATTSHDINFLIQ